MQPFTMFLKMTKKSKKNQSKKIKLKVTENQLIHLRDLMGITYLSDLRSVSHELSKLNGLESEETQLWHTIVGACAANHIPTDDEAPDYSIDVSASVNALMTCS